MTTTITETHTDDCTWIDHRTGNCGCKKAAKLQPYATLEEAKAAGPQGSHIRLNAIKTYLRAQREAKRAVQS